MSTIVCIGDSLVQGSPNWIARNMTSRLATKYPGCDIVNKGVGGETSAQVEARKTDVAQYKPFRVVVWAGINDMTTLTTAQTIANLQSMYTYFASLGAEVYALTITPNDDHTPTQVSDRETDNSNVLYVATSVTKRIDTCLMFKDPNDIGNRNPIYADPNTPNHLNDLAMGLLVGLM